MTFAELRDLIDKMPNEHKALSVYVTDQLEDWYPVVMFSDDENRPHLSTMPNELLATIHDLVVKE